MAKYLARAGRRVVVVTTSVGSKPGLETRDNILIYRLPVLKLLSDRYPLPALFSREYRKIIKELREFDFSLLILNTRFYLTTLIGLIISRKGNKNALIIEHGTGHIKLGNCILDSAGIIYEHSLTWVLRSIFNPRFYGVSQACNRWLVHFGINASGVIYNGIDAEYFNKSKINYRESFNLQEGSIVFSFAGRLIAEKGIIFILDLFRDFILKYPDAYLFVAGIGPLTEEAEKYKCENIIILGKLDHDEVMNLLSFTDVVLIPSKYPEGLPTLILEGGLSKCAVIATDRGGSKEVITNDSLGYIFPGNDRTKFFSAMEELMINPGHRKLLQENLHQVVISEFSWEIIIQGVLGILDKKS